MNEHSKAASYWDLIPLGQMDAKERAAFYDDLADDDTEEHLFFGDRTSHLYENPRLEACILEDDGRVVPAQGYRGRPLLKDTQVNVFLDRYFVAAMPGNHFDLQLAITSRHYFKGRTEPDRVAHTLAVKGVLNDYTNYLTEPVFRNLTVTDLLTLDIAVNFLSDRSTRRMLATMEHDMISKGVQLVSTFNPVFGTVAAYARGIVKMCLDAKKNVSIVDAHIGFTSEPGTLSPTLVEGTYLLFQPTTEEDKLVLKDATYDHEDRVLRIDGIAAPRNHLFLRVARAI
jgi:hypothetical protein